MRVKSFLALFLVSWMIALGPPAVASNTVPRKIKIIILPGLHGTNHLFKPFVDRAPADVELWVITYPTTRMLSYDQLADRVEHDLKNEGPFILLGESFSGPVALKAAAGHSPGLKGVILAASFALPPAPTWMRHLPWAFIFYVGLPSPIVRRLFADVPNSEAIVQETRQALRSVSPGVLASRLRATLTINAADALQACPVPILYLSARNDRVISPKSLQQILSLRSDVAVVEVQSPHFILQCKPDLAWQAIRPFIDLVVSEK